MRKETDWQGELLVPPMEQVLGTMLFNSIARYCLLNAPLAAMPQKEDVFGDIDASFFLGRKKYRHFLSEHCKFDALKR